MGEAKKERRREPSPSGKIGTLPHFIFGRDKAAEAAGVSENKSDPPSPWCLTCERSERVGQCPR
jgi:hypothetical protein